MILDWLSQYSGILNAFANTAYFLVWGLFLQLMYLMYRRKRLVQLLVNRGKQKDMEALCIVGNMSAQPVFIEYILAELETSQGTVILDVTDRDRVYGASDEEAADTKKTQLPRSGPLEAGGFLHIGSFAALVESLAQAGDVELQNGRPGGDFKFHSLTIRLIGVHGADDRPIGAERRFDLVANGQSYLPLPSGSGATQLSSRKQRQQLQKLAEAFFDRDRRLA